jgi:hypothetical protein
MQLQRPMTLGAAATDNGGSASYNVLLMNMLAGANALTQHQVVIYEETIPTGGLLGHTVDVTTTADDEMVAGVCQHDAAAGEPVLVAVAGVTFVNGAAGLAAQEAVSTHTVAGQVENATALTTSPELTASVVGVCLEALSAQITGKVLIKLCL